LIDTDSLSTTVVNDDNRVAHEVDFIPKDGPLKSIVSVYEKLVIEARLKDQGGNRSRTAESLDISRQALQAKLAKWKQASLEGHTNDATMSDAAVEEE